MTVAACHCPPAVGIFRRFSSAAACRADRLASSSNTGRIRPASAAASRRFYVAGIPERVIAEIMAWEEEHVARIIHRYVDRTAATRAILRQLNKKRT